MMVPAAPMNGAWPSLAQFPPSPPSILSHPSPLSSPTNYSASPSASSSSAPSPSPSTSSSSSSSKKRRNPPKKPCQAALDNPARKCRYKAHSKELKKHYITTHPEYAKSIGLSLDPIVCRACGTSLRAGRPDFLVRHQSVQKGKKTSACEKKLATLKKGRV
ncbi:hypothetical protein N0V85_009215 [Neurospora sp. IMI 360204]|nr:hypothetical protein N0V85_009215 [Neurospora sp. IMI 360204]